MMSDDASMGVYLLIDDDEVLTSVLARALTRRGYQCIQAHTAQQALDVCQSETVQYVVLDLKLAESSGLQLIPQLLTIQSEMKIVMLTGYSSIATAVEAIKLGAENYLPKPANVDDILAALSIQTRSEAMAVDELSPPSVDRLEWEHIQRVLQEHDGNISATARALGMHRRTLQRKLNKRPVKR